MFNKYVSCPPNGIAVPYLPCCALRRQLSAALAVIGVTVEAETNSVITCPECGFTAAE